MVRELLRLEGVHRAFGAVSVLDGINLRIDEGDRIGVVGHNGSGKPTLLRTISAQKQDVGDITFAPGLRIAYLTQIRDIDESATLEEELTAMETQMADPSFYEGDWQPVLDRYSELQALSARSGGTDVAGHAKNILDSLDLGHHPLDMPLSKLSGGERAKVALARQ